MSAMARVQAMGRYLLLNLEGGAFATEGFTACQETASTEEYAIVTQQHVLVVHSPGLRFLPTLRWQMDLGDLILASRCAPLT